MGHSCANVWQLLMAGCAQCFSAAPAHWLTREPPIAPALFSSPSRVDVGVAGKLPPAQLTLQRSLEIRELQGAASFGADVFQYASEA